jgi:hypothetical protein
VSSRLAQLTARRSSLQAECERQRDDVRSLYRGIEHTAVRADRVIEIARGFGPVIAVAGAVVLLVLGPGRVLRLISHGLAVGLYAREALRILR